MLTLRICSKCLSSIFWSISGVQTYLSAATYVFAFCLFNSISSVEDCDELWQIYCFIIKSLLSGKSFYWQKTEILQEGLPLFLSPEKLLLDYPLAEENFTLWTLEFNTVLSSFCVLLGDSRKGKAMVKTNPRTKLWFRARISYLSPTFLEKSPMFFGKSPTF